MVPLLTLAFGVDIRYANRRVAGERDRDVVWRGGRVSARRLFEHARRHVSEMATTVGAISGAALAAKLPTSTIAIVFG